MNKSVALALPLLIATGFYVAFAHSGEAVWLPFSLSHPLGTDEFGRDILGAGLAAAALSLTKGTAVAVIAILAATAFAYLMALRRHGGLEATFRLLAAAIEGVPIILWVLVTIIAMPEPRAAVVGIAFTLAVLPATANQLAGEMQRLRLTPFVEAAYMAGVSELRILGRHILPNAIAVIAPLTIQLLGMAIAVDGAIGVLGVGNRRDLDLGTFLLRGKELFLLHPQVLLTALGLYAALFGYLIWIRAVFRGR